MLRISLALICVDVHTSDQFSVHFPNILNNVRKIYALVLAALFIEILATLRRTTQDKYHPKDDSLRSDESCKDLTLIILMWRIG